MNLIVRRFDFPTTPGHARQRNTVGGPFFHCEIIKVIIEANQSRVTLNLCLFLPGNRGGKLGKMKGPTASQCDLTTSQAFTLSEMPHGLHFRSKVSQSPQKPPAPPATIAIGPSFPRRLALFSQKDPNGPRARAQSREARQASNSNPHPSNPLVRSASETNK